MAHPKRQLSGVLGEKISVIKNRDGKTIFYFISLGKYRWNSWLHDKCHHAYFCIIIQWSAVYRYDSSNPPECMSPSRKLSKNYDEIKSRWNSCILSIEFFVKSFLACCNDKCRHIHNWKEEIKCMKTGMTRVATSAASSSWGKFGSYPPFHWFPDSLSPTEWFASFSSFPVLSRTIRAIFLECVEQHVKGVRI